MNIISLKIMPFLLVGSCTGIGYKLLADELQLLRMAIYFCIAEKK